MNHAFSSAGKIARCGSSFLRASPFSTIGSKTINITFVDIDGNRSIVPALVGQSLMDAASVNKIDIEGPCGGGGAPVQTRRTKSWTETTWGEGPSCFYCHVQIASKYNSILPEFNDHERAGIEVTWDKEYTRNSRLACKIVLDERHDGMIVYVPDAPVTDFI